MKYYLGDLTMNWGISSILMKDHSLVSFWASLMAQGVKNLPAMWDTQVWSLGWEDPWRKEWQPAPIFLPGDSHGQRSLAGYSLWWQRVGHSWSNWAQHVSIQAIWYMQSWLVRTTCDKTWSMRKIIQGCLVYKTLLIILLSSENSIHRI